MHKCVYRANKGGREKKEEPQSGFGCFLSGKEIPEHMQLMSIKTETSLIAEISAPVEELSWWVFFISSRLPCRGVQGDVSKGAGLCVFGWAC